MLVRDIMASKVITVSPGSTVSEILKIFQKHKIGGAPVVSKSGKILGFVSEKDVLFRLFPSEEEFYKDVDYYFAKTNHEENLKAIRNLKAKNIMTRHVICVKPYDDVLSACSKLLLRHIRRLPVVDKGKLVGIVSTDRVFVNYLHHVLTERS